MTTDTTTDPRFSGLPGRPGKIVAIHLSYASRADQRGRRPAHPSYFFKPSSSVAPSGGTVERPAGTELLAFEGEIALVIGTAARRVPLADAWAHVAWVTASNDLGLYDLRANDKGSNVRSKGGDGFTPIGPELIDARTVDPTALRVRTWLNGTLVQDDTSAGMIFSLPQLVADLSQHFTLEPGDVILTGTPAGSSVAAPGDVIEVEVDVPGGPTSGRLVTTVVEGEGPGFDPALGSLPSVDDAQRADAWGSREAAGLPADPVAGPSTGSGTAPHPRTGPSTGSGTEPDPRTGPSTGSGTEPDPVAEPNPGAGPSTGSGTEPDPVAEPIPVTGPSTGSGAGSATGIPPLSPDLRAKLEATPVAGLSAQLRKRGLDNVHIDGLTPVHPDSTLVGTARTLRFVPNREDLFASHGGGYNAQKRMFDTVGEGEVIVIEARGETGSGTLGDVLAIRAHARGAAGIVTDGGVRDAAAVAAVGIPVFTAGPHPAVLGRKHVPWDVDLTVACGGATVVPGDVIVGDSDGVIVIPRALAEEVVDAARAQEDEDAWIAERVAEGNPIEGLFPMNAAWRARYDAERARDQTKEQR